MAHMRLAGLGKKGKLSLSQAIARAQKTQAKQEKKALQFAVAGDVAKEEIAAQGASDLTLAQGKADALRYWPWVAGGLVAVGALWVFMNKKKRR